MSARRPLSCACWPIGVLFLASVGLLSGGRVSAATPESWRIVRGDVKVLCPMTVGGSFEAKTQTLAGTLTWTAPHSAQLSGDLIVDLADLDTGIGLRNEHLRNTYLEVNKDAAFQHAVLSDVKLGEIDPETFQGRTTFSGTFALHGVKKPITGQAEIRREGASVRVEATFPVTIADYAIAKPQYLGVGVKDQVQVKVSLVAAPVEAAGAPR